MENTDNKLNIGAVEVLLLELYLYLRSPLATNVQGRLIVKPRCTRNVHLSHQHGRHEGSANTKAHSRLTGLRKRSPVMERRGDLRVGYSRGEYERERRPGGAEQGIGQPPPPLIPSGRGEEGQKVFPISWGRKTRLRALKCMSDAFYFGGSAIDDPGWRHETWHVSVDREVCPMARGRLRWLHKRWRRQALRKLFRVSSHVYLK